MARVACLTVQRDEEILLRPWLAYHGYLFGFENLIVLDRGSRSERVLAWLDEFARLGVRVERVEPVAPDADEAALLAAEVAALRRTGRYDVALPMACSAFLAADTADGIGCGRAAILEALDRFAAQERDGCTGYTLRNRPGFCDLFAYGGETDSVLRLGAGPAAGETVATQLIQLRLDAKPYRLLPPGAAPADEAAYYAPPAGSAALVRVPGFLRLLAGLGAAAALRAGLEACRPRDLAAPALVLDLDETPFSSDAYAEANPDLGGNLFRHCLTYGFLEGRLLRPGGHDEVMDRLARLRRRVMDGAAGYGGLANVAHRTGCYGEAEAILQAGLAQHGLTAVLGYEHALLAHYRGDYGAATARWRDFAGRHTLRGDQYASAIHSARCAGAFDQAQDWLAAALPLFPGNGHLVMEEAEAALHAEDHAGAARILAAATARFGAEPWIMKRIKELRFRLQMAALERPAAASIPEMDAPVDVELAPAELDRALAFYGVRDAAALAGLLKTFESLGQNCEFGLVQRRYGAEPLSLLRWTSIHLPYLMDALRDRLEGMDAPEALALEPRRTEYVLCNTRYATEMHTFQPPGGDGAKLLKEMTRRSKFLTGKLLADLDAAEKIFVRLEDQGRKPLPTATRLHDMLLTYGPNTLLYVTVSADERLWGTVAEPRPGLFIGHTRRFGAAAPGFDPPYADWDAIIRAVARARALLPPPLEVVR